MIPYRLDLEYSLAPGWLAPFAEALMQGRALGRECWCGRVSFPPLRVCDCGLDRAEWVNLPGTARIDWRTEGSDGVFALVRFDGADTAAVVRLDRVGPDLAHARLRPATAGLPQMVLEPPT